MPVTFQAAGSPDSGTHSSSTLGFPGTPSGQMLLAVYAFENVAAGSGPWISSSTGGGWSRTFYQAPSGGNGCGLEVWNTLDWSASPTNVFNFAASETYVGCGLVYTGQFFDGSTSPVRAVAQQAVTGSPVATPSITAFAGETLIAVAADTLAAPGFGTPNPSGAVQRFDAFRSAYGNAEATAADYPVAAGGSVGPFTWPATPSSGTARGAAAVLAVRPASSGGSSFALLDVPMPENLDLANGYTVRVTALDPDTGALVSGMSVQTVVLTASHGSLNAGSGGGDSGEWFLVPGPSA